MTIAARLRALALAVWSVVALSSPSAADIKAYNEAVTKNDFATAAAEAAATWPTLDKARPDIVTIAQEFAWTAMRAKKPDIASAILGSLAEAHVTDTKPELTAVLLTWASFVAKPDGRSRKALLGALDARAKAGSAENISILAGQELFLYEWEHNKFDDAARTAATCVRLLEHFGDPLIDLYFAMRRNELVAKFLDNRKRGNVTALDDLAEEIEARLAREADPKFRDRLIGEVARTIAWSGVERNVLQYSGIAVPEPRNGEEDDMNEEWFPTPGDPAIPVCDLELDTSGVRPEYPKRAESMQLPGFAVYAFEVGNGGKLESAWVLGSAPHDMFTETIGRILPIWRWKMGKKNPGGDCRRLSVYVVSFDFEMRRR